MRLLNFSDGFTSSTAPTLAGGSFLETYTILNNTIAGSLLTFDYLENATIFAEYELSRQDVGGVYIQQGTIIFAWDGTTWAIQPGNYTGVDMIVNTIANAYEIELMISGSGVVTYDSGNMSTSYVGTLKLNLTRIAV